MLPRTYWVFYDKLNLKMLHNVTRVCWQFWHDIVWLTKHSNCLKPMKLGKHSHYLLCCQNCASLYPRPTKLEGGYTGFTLSVRLSVCPSVRPSVRPSVCRRHGFRSISQVCFGISFSNYICMLMVAISRSLLIFSDVTFKMAAWRPYWIFWFPGSNFTLALNINFKLQRHNTYVYG